MNPCFSITSASALDAQRCATELLHNMFRRRLSACCNFYILQKNQVERFFFQFAASSRRTFQRVDANVKENREEHSEGGQLAALMHLASASGNIFARPVKTFLMSRGGRVRNIAKLTSLQKNKECKCTVKYFWLKGSESPVLRCKNAANRRCQRRHDSRRPRAASENPQGATDSA